MLNGTATAPEFSMEALAQMSQGLSGSDLKEMCRNAAMVPVREYVRGAAENQEILAMGELEVRSTSRSNGVWVLIICKGVQTATVDTGRLLFSRWSSCNHAATTS